jgi:IS605 OrfB family transposase
MTTLTYCKGLPTPGDELNPIGFTELEMFLTSLSDIFYQATVETVNHLLNKEVNPSACERVKLNQSSWNSHIQQKYGLSKRYANGVIALAKGKTASAKECRKIQIKQLKSRVKSAKDWVAKATKKIKLARNFYEKKNWQFSKKGCNFPLSSNLKTRKTNWHHLRQGLHQKKRYIYRLENQIQHLKSAKLRVKVSRGSVFIVGSKDESYGNQTCQWSGDTIKLRVPGCLLAKFGKYVTSQIGSFSRKINRLPNSGAKTWHFYRKDNRWVVAVQFTPAAVEKVSRDIQYGALGIDLNPSSIGWAYVDGQGNLKAQGTLPFQTGLPTLKQEAQLVEVCLKLAALARSLNSPIVCENLDFSRKKAQLRERGQKYARMLSAWAYSRFYQILSSILSNRGIAYQLVNPAYTSLIGLVKYSRMYGLSSDVAAALAIARRGMHLSERLPRSVSAYLGVNPRKHVWSALYQFNNFMGRCPVVNRRHDYYSVSNWEPLVKADIEQQRRVSAKRKR